MTSTLYQDQFQKKPNRRFNRQRRELVIDRRQSYVSVENCRRLPSQRRIGDRRFYLSEFTQSRSSHQSQPWLHLSIQKKKYSHYASANDSHKVGQFINLAI